jgi:hypothetical protein
MSRDLEAEGEETGSMEESGLRERGRFSEVLGNVWSVGSSIGSYGLSRGGYVETSQSNAV